MRKILFFILHRMTEYLINLINLLHDYLFCGSVERLRLSKDTKLANSMIEMFKTWGKFFANGVEMMRKLESDFSLNLIRTRVRRVQESLEEKDRRWSTQKKVYFHSSYD